MNIQAGDDSVSGTPATNFTVLRIKRDILRRSTVGAMFTNRSRLTSNLPGNNQAFGVDAAFGFYQNVAIGGYYARTETSNLAGNNVSYLGKASWEPDRYGVSAEHLRVGKAFNPEVGFLRRTDFTRSFASARFSPRPTRSKRVRKYTSQLSYEYYENGAGDVESRQATGNVNVEFNNSDTLRIEGNANYDLLLTPFSPAAGHPIPAGGYNFQNVAVSYSPGQQRKVSGNFQLDLGTFYSGHKTTLSWSAGTSPARVRVTSQFAIEPSLSFNWIDLKEGNFVTQVHGARVTYTMTPLLFVSSLAQYTSSTHSVSLNARFRWEYRPGSEIFVVYNDQRDTASPRFPELLNRALFFKINRLFRF